MMADAFMKGVMFTGSSIYPFVKLKDWYSTLYIGKFKEKQKFKIGVTRNLYERDSTLSNETGNRNASKMIHGWSLPFANEVETLTKRLLTNFINKDSDKEGKTEIILGIDFEPLLKIVQMVVLKVSLDVRFVYSNELLTKKLNKYFGGVPFNVVKYKNNTFTALKIKKKKTKLSTGTRVLVYYDQDRDGFTTGYYRGRVVKKEKKNLYLIKWDDKRYENTLINGDDIQLISDYEDIDVKRVLFIKNLVDDVTSALEASIETDNEEEGQRNLKF